MARKAEQVIAERAKRDEVRARFETHLSAFRGDDEQDGMTSRVAARIGRDAKGKLDEAIEIAEQNKGIIAGTIGLLALWFLRNPIISALDAHFGILGGNEQDSNHE